MTPLELTGRKVSITDDGFRMVVFTPVVAEFVAKEAGACSTRSGIKRGHNVACQRARKGLGASSTAG